MKRSLIILLALVGFGVSLYLYFPYINDTSVGLCRPAVAGELSGCDTVRISSYSSLFGVVLPIWGMLFYVTTILYQAFAGFKPRIHRKMKRLLGLQPDLLLALGGFLFSAYLTYISKFVIGATCKFCLIQAACSTAIFIILLLFTPGFYTVAYRIARPIVFLMNSEKAHHVFVGLGAFFGRFTVCRQWLKETFTNDDPILKTALYGKIMSSPLGLAAGFDYEGKLTQVLPHCGFAYESVGTITFSPYEGNAGIRMGRLIKSKALLVNKGLKNLGITETMKNVKYTDGYSVGISIGPTNNEAIQNSHAQIEDMKKAMQTLQSYHQHSYLELNISCPNSYGVGNLVDEESLEILLTEARKQYPHMPLSVKYPCEENWEKTRKLVQIMINHKVEAIIVSNLAKDRSNETFNEKEIASATKGNFSGAPCKKLSNILIKNIRKEFAGQIKIIGLGGIMNADDAYEKITLGADALQMISGMIFEGPAAMAQINEGLAQKLRENGYSSVAEAVGTANQD